MSLTQDAQAKVLFDLYADERAIVQTLEGRRETFTGALLTLTVAMLALLAHEGIERKFASLGAFIFALGVIGVLGSLTYARRAMHHLENARCYRDQLTALAEVDQRGVRAKGFGIRAVWTLLNCLNAAVGLAILLLCSNSPT